MDRKETGIRKSSLCQKHIVSYLLKSLEFSKKGFGKIIDLTFF